MKLFSLLFASMLAAVVMQAQSPVGKWKFYSWFTEYQNGKKDDILKDYIKEYPCITTVICHLTAGGKITFEGDKCPPDMKQPDFGTKWTMPAKNKITVVPDDDDTEIDPQTYDLDFTGNKMRWSMTFPDNYIGDSPGDNDNEVKLLVLEFIRL
jgi:hypothetical protein